MRDMEQLRASVEARMGDSYAKLDKELEAKMLDAFSDDAFVERIFSLDKPEDVQAAFAEKDLHFTVAEIMQMRDALVSSQSGELSDEQMEMAAGGSLTVLAAIGVAAGAAFLLGVAEGAVESLVKEGWNQTKKHFNISW